MAPPVLNAQSPVPLYRQLADRILADIREGRFAPGSRIPSEPQLAAACNIGRPTVRQAIDVLVRKGVLTRRRGSGTYVCEPRQEVDLFSLDGTTSSFQKKGVSVETRLLSQVHRVISVADPDSPFAGQTALCLTRLSMVHQTPVLMEEIHLHPVLFNGIEAIDLSGQSLSAIADEHFYLCPIGGRQRFSIGYAAGQKARDLQVTPDTPLLVVQRFLHFPGTANGVYCRLWCRSDQFVFSQTIGGVEDA
jgi:GntR family transcriptional regulator